MDPVGQETTVLLEHVEALMQRLVHTQGLSGQMLGRIATEHLQTGGKRLRARLAIAATVALGGDTTQAIAWAAACELSHNATLVHDDVQDGDKVRRGKPTIWATYGVAQAINAGDLLLILPYLALGQVPIADNIRWYLSEGLAQHIVTVIHGQSVECMMHDEGIIDRQVYTDMIRGKTSALFTLPVYGAAIIAGHTPAQATALSQPFAALGTLFQMQDDVLDLFGDKGRDAVGSDLREGKISALVVEHLALHPNDKHWLFDILRTPREVTSDTMVAQAIARFEHGGAKDAVLQAIHMQANIARQQTVVSLQPILNELITFILKPITCLF